MFNAEGVAYTLMDHASTRIEDCEKAQFPATYLKIKDLHQGLDGFARGYCPIIEQLGMQYH
jgi:hypothetical protein